jgi:hypothetical protein
MSLRRWRSIPATPTGRRSPQSGRARSRGSRSAREPERSRSPAMRRRRAAPSPPFDRPRRPVVRQRLRSGRRRPRRTGRRIPGRRPRRLPSTIGTHTICNTDSDRARPGHRWHACPPVARNVRRTDSAAHRRIQARRAAWSWETSHVLGRWRHPHPDGSAAALRPEDSARRQRPASSRRVCVTMMRR